MIYSLQGLRAISMIIIFLFHAGIVSNGIFAVTFFFTLSGFVLYYQYHAKIEYCNIKESIKWGLAKIRKLYIVHMITFFISIIIRWDWIMSYTIKELIIMGGLNITLLQSLVPKYSLTFNAASWYLSTTFICYLLIPIIIVKVKNINKNKFAIFTVFLIQTLLVLIIPITFERYSDILYMSPFIRIFDFIIGMLVAKIYLSYKESRNINYNLKEYLTVFLFIITYVVSLNLPVQFTRGWIYTPIFTIGIYTIALSKGCVSKFLSKDIFQYLSKISFEFYMVHELVLMLLRNILQNFEARWLIKEVLLIAIPSFIISLVLAIGINKYITKKKSKEYLLVLHK